MANDFVHNQQSYQSSTAFWFVAGCDLLVVIAIFIVYHILYVRIGIRFPGPQDDSFILIKHSWTVFKHNVATLYSFDPEYIIRSCGIEAYQYIYFQRSLLQIMLIFNVIAIFSIALAPHQMNFFLIDEKFTQGYQYVMTLIYTVVLLWYLKGMMEIMGSMETSKKKTQWLIQHTIHLKGIPLDMTREALLQKMQFYLTDHNLGMVLSVYVIPKHPIKQLMKSKSNDHYEQYKMNLFLNCYKPNYIEIPPVEPNSGHAFISVDSDAAFEHLLQTFTFNKANISCMRQYFADPFCGHYEDQYDCLGSTMLAIEAPQPIDIVYQNLHINVKSIVFRKICYNFLMFLILVFCTTPMSVVQIMGFDLKAHTIEVQYFSLLLVAGINQLLLLLIDLFAKWERHTSKSLYQKSIYTRSVFYLTMNMLIVPAFSFLAVNNLYEIIMRDATNLMSIIQAVYFLSNGKFFVILIFQSGCFSLVPILRLDELFTSWISPSYAQFKRVQMHKYPYLQELNDMFSFGYYYGVQITILYIVMTFSTNIPIIHLAGASYYLCRCYADGLNLQTVFREEINSNGKLVHRAIVSAACTVIPLQVLDLVMFALAGDSVFTLIQVIMMAGTLIAILYLSFLGQKITQESKQQINTLFSTVNAGDIDELLSLYKHPLQ